MTITVTANTQDDKAFYQLELRDIADNKGLIQVKLKQLKPEKFMLSAADDGEMGNVDLDSIKQGSFGLRIVQAFSTQLGGHLEVNNSKGTCFTLLFNDQRAA